MARLEIELKYAAPEDIRARLLAIGAVPQGDHTEQDHYLDAPDRDFAVTNEVFRIRVVDGQCAFTYKGPRQGGSAKIRAETELPIAADLADALALVESLGYRSVAVVEKRRDLWTLARGGFDLTISLDSLAFGEYVEVEIVATEDDKSRAETVLMNVCAELKLERPEPRSYLRMTLERAGR